MDGKNLQIMSIDTAIVKDQKELNLYVDKAQKFRSDLDKLDTVTEDNYEATKSLRADISANKTAVETARKTIKAPLLALGKAIDARALELATPFADMKDEVNEKIAVYEKAENERKEAEAKRVQGIIEKIGTFETIEDLTKYYKSLDSKDQRKKTVAEAGTLRKSEINEEIRIQARDKKEEEISHAETIEELEKIDLGEFKEELGILVDSKVNKIKLDALEAEKAENIKKENETKANTNDLIEKLERETMEDLQKYEVPKDLYINYDGVVNWIKNRINELENKKLKEAQEKRDQEDLDAKKKNQEALEKADKTTLDLLIQSLKAQQNLEALTEYVKTIQDKLTITENRQALAKAIQDRKDEIEQEAREKNTKIVDDFVKPYFNNPKFKIDYKDTEVIIWEKKDTLDLLK